MPSIIAISFLVLAAAFAGATIISFAAGVHALLACMLAFAAVAISTVISMIPVFTVWRGQDSHLAMATMTSIIIRLLLLTIFVVIIMFLVKVSPVWFIIWLAVFYCLTLVFETLVVLSRMSARNAKG